LPYKVSLVFFTTAFYFVVYLTMPNILGWPATQESLPDRFKLISSTVDEPNKVLGSKGTIYVWVLDPQNVHARPVPRSYALPYKRELHKKVTEAQKRIAKGIDQLAEIRKPITSLDNSRSGYGQTRDDSIAIDFFDLPDPSIPQK